MTNGNGLLFASLASVCWGIGPILYKRAMREMGPWKANFFRGVGILALLVPMFFFMGEKFKAELLSLEARAYLILAAIAFMNNMIGDVLYLAAIRDIGVSLAAPITSSYPLAVALGAWLCFGEDMTLYVVCGTLFVVAGLVLLNIRNAGRGEGNKRHIRGVTFAFLGALCWALGLSLNKYLTIRGAAPVAITFWRAVIFGVMAVASLPLAVRGEKGKEPDIKTRRVSAGSFFAAACSGISVLVIGGWFFTTSLLIVPISVATPIASSNPLLAAGFACAFMGESLRPIQWLGILFVIGGAVAVGIG